MAKTVKYFPVAAAKSRKLVDSYNRKYIPGTGLVYSRGKHGGIDIVAPHGALVRACHAGTIRLRSFGKAYGLQVTIVAGDGTGFFHAHLSKIKVKEGQKVNTGEPIGNVGSTGQTSGPHVHFEKRLRWRDWRSIVNPYRELERARLA